MILKVGPFKNLFVLNGPLIFPRDVTDFCDRLSQDIEYRKLLMKNAKARKRRKIEADGQTSVTTGSPGHPVTAKEFKGLPIKKTKRLSSANVDMETKDVDVMETEDFEDSDEDCAAKPCKQPTGDDLCLFDSQAVCSGIEASF